MWTVNWDGDFVVGGDGNQRLTPAFRLKEFRAADGSVRVHRELVSALQLMRDRLGRSLSVKRTHADGFAAVVASDGQPSDLRAAAVAIRDRGIFTTIDAEPDGLGVRIPLPERLPPLGLDEALETAFSVTAAFETAGDKFQQITGNFDGAGLSFGPAQVNFGSGTLVPLFRKFLAADESALRGCFTDSDDYDDFMRVLNASAPQQIQWATSITTGRGGHDVVEPWRGYFQAVGRVPLFREITAESILSDYGAKAARAVRRSSGCARTSRSIASGASARSTISSCSRAASTRRGARSSSASPLSNRQTSWIWCASPSRNGDARRCRSGRRTPSAGASAS